MYNYYSCIVQGKQKYAIQRNRILKVANWKIIHHLCIQDNVMHTKGNKFLDDKSFSWDERLFLYNFFSAWKKTFFFNAISKLFHYIFCRIQKMVKV